MYMKNRILFFASLALIATCQSLSAQTVKGNDVEYTFQGERLRISFCTGKMFRVSKTASSSLPADEPWMVQRYAFPQVSFQVNNGTITTRSLVIKVENNPWRITVSDLSGRVCYEETAAGVADSIYNEAVLGPDEHFFGLGERMDRMDQRGQRVHLNVELGRGSKPAVGGKDILRANYCPVPIVYSTRGYAIFFHTAQPNDWDMGWTHANRFAFSSHGGSNDYYFIYGPDISQMLKAYLTLTGSAPLMPKPAYGLHVGSYSGGTWKHEKEVSDTYVRNLISRLRAEQIPFDLLWLDSTWRNFTSLGNGGCSFEFQSLFKDPAGMISFAHKNHVAMFGLHIRSLLDNGLHNTLLTDARKKGYTIDDGESRAILDFFNPKAVEWWWKEAAGKVTRLGVDFFKTDVGSALRFKNVTPEQQALHNLFPIAYAKAPYEHFAAMYNRRGFDHTREGWAGIQRYPFIWAGDWGSEWQWFEPVVRGGLNIGLSGVGNWSHCMGGFEQYSPYDTDLYVRWCQFGMFSPVAILFGMDHPRYHAPWTYGKEAERIFIKYDSLRYALLPYIYTSAWNMYQTGRPIMAPMLYDFFKDEQTYDMSDQYMFGPGMMVCPVTTKGALSRPVYFPGGNWTDYWTGERINGRQYKSFLTPLDIMPIFIREGAVIPMQQPMQYVDERPADSLTLLVYPSGQSSYKLYEDDGTSTDYQHGHYATTLIESKLTAGEWQLVVHQPTGTFKPQPHFYRAEAFLNKKPAQVTVNGQPTSQWTWDETRRLLRVEGGYNNKDILTITAI